MSLRCSVVARRLPRLVDGPPLRPRAESHVAGCLRCQAGAARYRMVARGLRSLRTEKVAAPGWLATAVGDAIDVDHGGPGRRRAHRIERAVVTGAAVAIAGTVAVLARRRKRAA